MTQTRIPLKWLLFLPVFTYTSSYCYLAYYHGRFFIFNTVVHEDGKYTLWQSIFYASHLLGHLPVHTMLAFLFSGWYCSLTGCRAHWPARVVCRLAAALIVFLAISCALSLGIFGYEDTRDFLLMRKQGVEIYEQGGAWNLHLPSSMLLFALIPIYIYVVNKASGHSLRLAPDGAFYIGLALGMLLSFTVCVNAAVAGPFTYVWTAPRYLAHSVRELLTFPLTYFPIPLYVILRCDSKNARRGPSPGIRKLNWLMAVFFVLFLSGLCYQSWVSLEAGIGKMAQKPPFARGGELGIPYLLASHYFEHVLESIYFTLLSLWLYGMTGRHIPNSTH